MSVDDSEAWQNAGLEGIVDGSHVPMFELIVGADGPLGCEVVVESEAERSGRCCCRLL